VRSSRRWGHDHVHVPFPNVRPPSMFQMPLANVTPEFEDLSPKPRRNVSRQQSTPNGGAASYAAFAYRRGKAEPWHDGALAFIVRLR